MSEIDFLWVESPYRFPFLRETYVLTGRPKGKPKIGSGLLAGYGNDDGESRVGGAYRRRMLYLESRDYPLDERGVYNPEHPAFHGWPYEAVCPLSVVLGGRSRKISDVTRVEAMRRAILAGRSASCSSLASLS